MAADAVQAKEAGNEAAAGGAAGASTTLAASAYHKLRDDILGGVLPPGAKLRFHDLRAMYGIGVAPIREALVRLQSEQLVSSADRRGYWVSSVSIDELRDLTRVRVLLEAEALRGSIDRGGDEWEATVVSAYHRLARVTERGAHLTKRTLPEWESRHDEFHLALISGDGSLLLQRLRLHLAQLVMRYRRYALAVAGARPHLEEHRRIMEAALAHDAEQAVALLTEHYELTTQAILAKFEGSNEEDDQ